MARHIAHRMIDGPRFNVEFWPGDDMWASSLHLRFRWFGRNYWHCWFFG